MKSEEGFSLIEVLVSLLILAIIGLAFLSALATSARATMTMDERTTAKNLACSQMEYVKSQDYEAVYAPAAIPDDCVGYSASILAEPLHDQDIQKITVEIEHNGQVVTTFEAYKVNR